MKINSQIIELLKRVQETDSLDNAVKEMGLFYSYGRNTLYKTKNPYSLRGILVIF